MPPQVVRLILLTAGIIGSYFVARALLTPRSFGEFGWYRGEALREQASQPITFGGKKACEECHSDEVKKLAGAGHKTLSCEGCHGAGQAHVENPEVKIGHTGPGLCVKCHEADPSRPKWHKQINSKSHYGANCVECHVPHQPSEVP